MHILTLIHKRWGEHLTTTIFNTVQIRGPTAFPVLMGVENPNKRDGNLKRLEFSLPVQFLFSGEVIESVISDRNRICD